MRQFLNYVDEKETTLRGCSYIYVILFSVILDPATAGQAQD